MDKITLTKTQFFLRYLKKNGIYNDYIREMHERGRTKLSQAIDKDSANPIFYLNASLPDLFWSGMMSWPESSNHNYLKNGHTFRFWETIDNKWVDLCQRIRQHNNRSLETPTIQVTPKLICELI